MSTNNYAQLCPISFVGEKELQVSKIDFETCCPCQITACDGGIINVCAKIKFKEGFIFDGDICDIDGGATFYEFTSVNGYYLEHSTSTCEEPVAKTQAITYFTDTTGTDGTVLSTVFDNYAGTPGNAYIQINSCLDQPLVNPPTSPVGLIILGGTLDRTKNLRIQTDTGTSDAVLQLEAKGTNGKIEATSADNIELTSTGANIELDADYQIICETTTDNIYLKSGNNIITQTLAGEIRGRYRDGLDFQGYNVFSTIFDTKSAFLFTLEGVVQSGNNGDAYWGTSDLGQRVTSSLPTGGTATSTFPKGDIGMYMWPINFSPVGEQQGGNSTHVVSGVVLKGEISNETTVVTGPFQYERFWTNSIYLEPHSDVTRTTQTMPAPTPFGTISNNFSLGRAGNYWTNIWVLYTNGLTTVPCDERFKKNLLQVEKEKRLERYDKLKQIEIYSYDYDGDKLNYEKDIPVVSGITTQNLKKVGLEDLVNIPQKIKEDETVPESIHVNPMFGFLINSIQILQRKVEELEKNLASK